MAEQAWQQIQSLPIGTHVGHWSVLKGNLSGRFSVVEVTDSAIFVETGPGTIRRISRNDFDSVAKLWGDYKDGRVTRDALSHITVNSTYILSLLHLIERGE